MGWYHERAPTAVGWWVGVLLPRCQVVAKPLQPCCCTASCATALPGPAVPLLLCCQAWSGQGEHANAAAPTGASDVPGGWLLQATSHTQQPGLAFLAPTVPAARSRQAAEAGEPL